MTDTTALDSALAFYERHGAALFPIPAGQKAPFGIVASFKKDWSRDPAQWAAWQAEHHCNFGVVAFASGWIICDTDTSGGEAGRAEAWAMRAELLSSWGMDPATLPHVQSARGGWHDYFAVPSHIDASQLRQPDAIRKRINIRCIGFTVAAGSHFVEDGIALPYILLSDAAPHPAPAALLEHCTRKTTARPAISQVLQGARDRGDVAALLVWLNERGAFEDYESWFQIGMALRLEYGDDGFDLWELTHDGTVSPDQAVAKWNSFATEPTADSVTLNSFLDRAHKMGWHGSVRKSTAAMFSEVAKLAAASGASLSSGMPTPPVGMPMMAGQEELARLERPRLLEFLAATSELSLPAGKDFPALPVGMNGHALFTDMQTALQRIFALAESKAFKSARIGGPMVALGVMHREIFDSVCRRLNAMGHTLPDKKWRLGIANMTEEVQRITVTHEKWEYDPKTGAIEADNPDNILTLLGMLGLEIRWNDWLECMEIQGDTDPDFQYPEWTYVEDVFVAKLITRAKRTKTRFRPGKDFTWESLITFAHKNRVDPAKDLLDVLAKEWDGVARLSSWLTKTCGTSATDPYYSAVANSVIGGMVRRIRKPGCKHDTMPVFFGPQGTGKSTMAKIIADMGQSSLAEINRRSAEWFSDEILLGDASKELVLSLAGKCLVEIGEMGQRSSVDIDQVKAMLSRQVDRGRTAYARSVTKRPRRNIFFGTVNGDTPLQDPTGNRRHLPVAVSDKLNLQWLSDNIKQLIGEAATLESTGADFALPEEVYAIAAAHQEAARSVSDVEARLAAWFAETAFTATAFVSTADLAELCEIAGWRKVHTLRNAVMKRLGFREIQPYIHGERTRGWLRGPEMMPRHVEKVTRYMVGKTHDGRPRVTIQGGSALPPLPYGPTL